MTTKNHTPVSLGSAANSSTINAPLGQLDSAMGDLETLTTTAKDDLVAAINELDSTKQDTYTSQSANKVMASPDGSSGVPGFRSLTGNDLPASGVTPGTFAKVTVNNKGLVTNGATAIGTSDISDLTSFPLDTLGSPTDNTNLDATTSRHGLLPKLANDATKFLSGLGTWIKWACGVKYNSSGAYTPRSFINFTGAGVSVTDDSANDAVKVTISGIAGGDQSLEALTDVSLTSPLNNNVLTYEQATGLWKNLNISSFVPTGHVVQEEGSNLTNRPNINFIGDGITVTDNSSTNATDVTVLMNNNRNAIINGAMDIWQRGKATLTNPVINTYFPDRFKTHFTLGDGTYNLLAKAETPTATFPFQYSLEHDTTHIETAVAAGEYSALTYTMEGYDFKRFEGQTATLSFWVKSVKTGTFCVAFRNNAVDKSYVHEYTINTTNTWEKKTVTLTFDSGGTFLYTNGVGLYISWTIMGGSNIQIATANKDTWQAGNYFATDAQVNGMDSTDNKFYLTGVQMELGSVATPFEFRPFAEELALCKRYCISATGTYEYNAICQGLSANPTTGIMVYVLENEMRATPTATFTATNWQLTDLVNAGVVLTTMTVDSRTSPRIMWLETHVASGLTQYRPYLLRANNSANEPFIVSAEL